MMKFQIYVASSWKNPRQPYIVKMLREEGFELYDFRHPSKNADGFSWSSIDPNWNKLSFQEQVSDLSHENAVKGFMNDLDAIESSQVCLLLLPSGRSSHIEAGYMKGKNKQVLVYCDPRDKAEIELMYKMFDLVSDDINLILDALRSLRALYLSLPDKI